MTPVPKIATGGLAGAVTLLAVFVAGLFGVNVTAETASALTLLLTFGAGYLKA